MRLLWTALAVLVSAALTGIAFGVVYGASLTPVGWRNPMVLGFGALVLAGALGGLGFLLYDIRGDDIWGIPVRETAVAACVAATMLVCWMALEDQALHERGRAVRAVVTDLRPSTGVYDAGTNAVLADAAHHRRLGVIGAGHLAVGDLLTVTVDPRGRYGVSAGPPPATPEWLWDLAAVIAAVQALFTASLGFSAARVRER
ncbi:hypothetical protein [Streptomyces sp. MBT62]|uniref:hypothetical protein n=1 Tax=Streptomyces sp. MBT62 TaxID=2800410 RepID=UPI00190BC63A|nr:hypothetical protein [Streptomyces sp. MBT62]MBK3562164.1 hypothetical protein [Streptomyces sp. MBT62]